MGKTRKWISAASVGAALSALLVEDNYNYRVVSLALHLSAVPTTSAFFTVARIRPAGSVFFGIDLVRVDMATCNLNQYLSNEIFECLARDRINAVYSNPDLLNCETEIIIERI